MITWEIKIINQKFSINFIKKDKTNKLNKFLFYLLQIYHFFDSFLVFLEHFQLKHVSSFILDQYLIAFFIFQFHKVHSYLQIIKDSVKV